MKSTFDLSNPTDRELAQAYSLLTQEKIAVSDLLDRLNSINSILGMCSQDQKRPTMAQLNRMLALSNPN